MKLKDFDRNRKECQDCLKIVRERRGVLLYCEATGICKHQMKKTESPKK